MNVDILIRDFKLFRLGTGELDDNEAKIYNFLVDNLCELNTYTSVDIPRVGWLYFGKSEIDIDIVLFYNPKCEDLYVNYGLWYFLNEDLNIRYIDVPKLISWWVGVVLNLKPKNIYESGQTSYLKPKHIYKVTIHI